MSDNLNRQYYIDFMRGLMKITHAIQTAEAKKDFARILEIAKQRGRDDLAATPLPEGSWRKIDRQLARIRAELGLTLDDWLAIK